MSFFFVRSPNPVLRSPNPFKPPPSLTFRNCLLHDGFLWKVQQKILPMKVHRGHMRKMKIDFHWETLKTDEVGGARTLEPMNIQMWDVYMEVKYIEPKNWCTLSDKMATFQQKLKRKILDGFYSKPPGTVDKFILRAKRSMRCAIHGMTIMNVLDNGRWKHPFHVTFRAGYFRVADPEEDQLNREHHLVFPTKNQKELSCGCLFDGKDGSRSQWGVLVGVKK